MKADKDTLRKIAHLARLEFDPAAEQKMLDSLNDILNWVDQLNQVDTSQVEPLTHLSEEVNIMRKDEVKPPLPHDRGLVNAPKKDADYFRVPKVIE